MSDISKNMSNFSKSMSDIYRMYKFLGNSKTPGILKLMHEFDVKAMRKMRDQLQELNRRKVIDATAEVSDAAPDAKTVNLEILDAKYMPRHLHNSQAYVSDMNKARASADAIPLY